VRKPPPALTGAMTDEHPAAKVMAQGLKRSMSSREMIMKGGKEIVKSVVVVEGARQVGRRLGLSALASSVSMAASGLGLAFARKWNPDYLDPVSSNQIIRDPEYCMNCHLLVPTRDTVDMQTVREVFEFYTKTFARFRQRIVVRDYLWPYWEEVAKVDLDNHIFQDFTEVDHRTIQDYISNSLTTGANPLLPLWKVVVFPNYIFEDGGKGSVIFLKWHHSMGDGFSFVKTLMTAAKDRSELPPRPEKKGGNNVEVGKTMGAATKLLTMQDDPPSSVKAKSLMKPLDKRIACILTSRMPISEIKKAAKTKGYTINDLAIAALSAALRNFQIERKAKLMDPLAIIWVALRPIAEAFEPQDLNTIEEPGNRTLGCVYVRLPVEKDFPTKADRVEAVVSEISKLKGSPEPVMAQSLMKMFGLMPMRLSNFIWHALSNKVSIAVSNVPGPPIDFTWCGAHPAGLAVLVPPVGTISTFSVITSFQEQLTISLAMDGNWFSREDADFISTEFDKELCSLTSSMAPSRL